MEGGRESGAPLHLAAINTHSCLVNSPLSTSSLRWNRTRCPVTMTWAPFSPAAPRLHTVGLAPRARAEGPRGPGTFWAAGERPPARRGGWSGERCGLESDHDLPEPAVRPRSPPARGAPPLLGGREKSFEALSSLPPGRLGWFCSVWVEPASPGPENQGMNWRG